MSGLGSNSFDEFYAFLVEGSGSTRVKNQKAGSSTRLCQQVPGTTRSLFRVSPSMSNML